MADKKRDWRQKAQEDAADFLDNIEEQVIEYILDDNEASDDFRNEYDGADEIFHTDIIEKEYDLLEAAEILDQLDEFEETDSGLWEGQEPRQAIATQAAFTYGNAVERFFQDLIEEINDKLKDIELDEDNEAAEKQIKKIIKKVLGSEPEEKDDESEPDEKPD